jgi:hypothetical protein
MTNNNSDFLSCDIINILQDYTFNENNIEKSLKNRFEITQKNKHEFTKTSKAVVPNNFFIPSHKDSLFWCFYIMKHGDVNYELLGKINPVIEKQIKIEYVEKIRKEKQLIKLYKFASISNIENQLVNENKIDLKTFLTLCALENINVFFINKRTYYELTMNDSKDVFVINAFDKERYGFKILSIEDCELENHKATLFKIDNIDKPIKSISSYKVQELIDYCNKLLISVHSENGKTKTKKDLYESFTQYF